MRLQLVSVGLLALPLFASAGAQAAGVTPPRRFGIAAGINSSTLSGDETEDVSRRTGFMAGVFLVAPLGPTISFQPELLYTTKGAKGSGDDIGSEGTFTFKMNYVEVPLLLRFDAATTGGMKPFFYGGPALSFKAGCEVEVESQGVSATVDCDEGEGTEFKSVDYGLVVGGGLAFDLSGRMFTLGARYNHGLANISDEGNVKHRVISVLATLEFPGPR